MRGIKSVVINQRTFFYKTLDDEKDKILYISDYISVTDYISIPETLTKLTIFLNQCKHESLFGAMIMISSLKLPTYITTFSYFILFLTSFYCQHFNERNSEEILYNRLHPQDTNEIQQSLSSDLEEKEKSQARFFAAVIDAGSTGTRLHIFEFSHDPTHAHSIFELESETFKEVKPGVSTYAKTPELAAENVRELLLVAKKYIPYDLWEKTPLTFRATAGVRLLNEKEADAILTNIESEVMSSGFLIDDDAVGVLSGIDEGVFGWFTLNFLLSRLNNLSEKSNLLL